MGNHLVLVPTWDNISTGLHVNSGLGWHVVAMVRYQNCTGYVKKLLETAHSFGHTPPGIGIKDGLKVAIL
jgi:hypothetical protein